MSTGLSLAAKLSQSFAMTLALFQPKAWEIALALRYLRTKRKDGGIAVIAMISFVGIALSVLALVAVLSIMNGFRAELMGRMLAFNGHAYIFGQPLCLSPKEMRLSIASWGLRAWFRLCRKSIVRGWSNRLPVL